MRSVWERPGLREAAAENERIVAAGWYTAPGGGRVEIGAAVARAAAGSALFGPEPVPRVPGAPGASGASGARTAFEVTGETSLAAARRLAGTDGGPVAVLNFASARNPGGGYLKGAKAQEEDLCRASALYTCLLRVPEFYAAHRAAGDPFYSDRVIHSPGVPVFRDDRGVLLDEPYEAGFLTSAAPNAGVVAERTPERAAGIPAAVRARAERVLEVAAVTGYRRLVLGAWGCGVFRNDPAVVAGAFHTLLTGSGRFARHFDRIVFAVFDRHDPSPARHAFATAFPAA
ncbi:TIGR02452 family protein [Streptomyces sp. URMC 129]|uniref:TIGR02452 family protein n=1 Tax=Streptomyces sp. URMC 129 TaxID=3423407 RepID=UPI003F1A0A14